MVTAYNIISYSFQKYKTFFHFSPHKSLFFAQKKIFFYKMITSSSKTTNFFPYFRRNTAKNQGLFYQKSEAYRQKNKRKIQRVIPKTKDFYPFGTENLPERIIAHLPRQRASTSCTPKESCPPEHGIRGRRCAWRKSRTLCRSPPCPCPRCEAGACSR